ncbi:MAG: oligosaccharide flippase family protein [Clostridia bacterium]|nr:oligosaccharide flippase family protein [Clostridia bacterium]
MNALKKLISNTFIIGLGTIGSKLLVFLLMPLYTAWLTTEDYGTAELITTTANLLIPVACLGITNGIFRFAAEKESNQTEVFSSGIALLGIGLIAFLALSPVLLLIDFISEYYWLVVLFVLLANIQAVCAQYVRAIDNTRLFAVQGILNTALTIFFNVLFLYVWDLGLVGYVLSVVAGNALTVLFLVFVAKLWRVFRPQAVRKHIMKEMLFFSLPMIPTTICWLITDLSDRYMVTAFYDANVTGVYSAAYKVPTLVNLASGIFMQAWQFSAVAESSDEASAKRFYSRVFRGFLSVIFIGSAGLILLSRVLTSVLLNSAYHGAAEYMPTLLCAVAMEAIVSFLATVYMVRKLSMHSFLTAMAGTVCNIILNFILIPRVGPLGAAIATMASYGAVLVLRLWDVHRIMRFRLYLPRMLVSIALLLGAASVMTFVQTGRFWWTLLITAIAVAINAPALLSAVKEIFVKRKE